MSLLSSVTVNLRQTAGQDPAGLQQTHYRSRSNKHVQLRV